MKRAASSARYSPAPRFCCTHRFWRMTIRHFMNKSVRLSLR